MRSAVDSSLLLDILLDDPEHAKASMLLLEASLLAGPVIICPVAFCESAAALFPPSEFRGVASEMGLIYDDFDVEICTLAAQMWRDYRTQGGPRQRVLADFLIGAHSQRRADRLLSRDRGFYRGYFQSLEVISPS